MPGSTQGATPWGLPRADLDEGIDRAAADLSHLSGAQILVTGGTGFLGSWLVASLLAANARQRLGLRISLLTRHPDAVPLDDGGALSLLQGDVRQLPAVGSPDFIVHGAATSSATYGKGDGDPRQMAETIVEGTREILSAAATNGARVLFLSSGAVYGRQQSAVAEDCRDAPDPMDPRSSYGLAKLLAENLCAIATQARQADAVVARLFAFVGPRIPLTAHFAVGNFLQNALQSQPIVVRGDGQAMRSYLYAGDLPEWCWALLARGRAGVAYNVGSPDPVSIGDLAQQAAELPRPSVEVRVVQPPSGVPEWYVPCTDRAEGELGLRPRTPLGTSLRKTYEWFLSGADH